MIIPIKCFTCGMVIADKYRYYQEQVRNKKLAKRGNGESIDVDKVLYLTKEFVEKTPEGEVLDELNMKKMCCRRHFLTHVDIE
ncbi:MAG: RpoN/RPB10 RNA polymerase subunit family protein [Candidatus Marinimicrobia bacterium]|jgi:DNA-directed RNA polymerase subunit N|nr:RpoN/RPB10 RNA polymerase subunit family protein [Candidatus Neomarinimicrobiota bacterium]